MSIVELYIVPLFILRKANIYHRKLVEEMEEQRQLSQE